MDLKLRGIEPSAAEREAVDAVLGPPRSSWEGGARGNTRDARTAETGGAASRERRHLLLPVLRSLQARAGWISEGGLDYACARLNVAPADAWGVATFYALLSTTPQPARIIHVCDDIACKCRGADALVADIETRLGPPLGRPKGRTTNPVAASTMPAGWTRSPCLGLCDQAPSALVTDAGPNPDEHLLGRVDVAQVVALFGGAVPASRERRSDIHQPLSSLRLLKRVNRVDPGSLDAYRSSGGYAALAQALSMGAEEVIAEVAASRLLGNGGAAFPTGRKWAAVAREPAPRYLVCNADESEPGTFKDRVLLEGDPFSIVESMTIAAFATGCTRGFAYVRGEYPLAAARLQHAVDEARRAGLLGADILGSGFDFDVEIRRGAGAYVCGEETALFESIEGRSGFPRNKPPFPVTRGLFGRPTVVNNVETLANVPHILLEGAEGFAALRDGTGGATRLFCLSGSVRRPGVYEAPLGTPLRALIELAGGVADGRTLSAVLLGGAAGTFLRPDEIDLPLTHDDARAAGATLGSGVVLVLDDSVDLRDIVLRIASFFRDESCGQCVPCRVGVVRQEEALHRLRDGAADVAAELALVADVGLAMRDASICGLGQTAYAAIESAIAKLGVFGGPAPGPPSAGLASGNDRRAR